MSFQVAIGREHEYARAKRLLNLGRHPVFIGRNLVERHARNGGLLFFRLHGKDQAVAIVNARLSILLTLNVQPAHRSHGLGAAIVRFLKCNFVRSTLPAVSFFERLGYLPIGDIKQGRTLGTRIMVREDVMRLAGRVSRIFSAVDS